MKNIYYILAFFLCGTTQVFAQASGEITTKGVIYPRYTDSNRPSTPLTIGTTIFNTNQNTHQYWNGSSWTNVSTPGSGGGPWSAVSNSIYNNTGNRVGINSANPVADLEIQGNSGLLISLPYTVTTDPPTTTTTMPYSGTLATITANAGRILDPGGNGNFLTNTTYYSYIAINPTETTYGFRFTFESLDLGSSTIIFSTSSDINNSADYILKINSSSAYVTGRPFTIDAYSIIYIHFIITGGGTAAAGFQLLYENIKSVSFSNTNYSEPIFLGLSFNSIKGSFSSGYRVRAKGDYSIAMGFGSIASGYASTAMGGRFTIASGDFSTAMGGSTASGGGSTAMGGSTASGDGSTAMGGSTASGDGSTAIGNSTASGLYSTAMGFSIASGSRSTAMGGGNTNNKVRSFSIEGSSSVNRATNDKDYQMKMHFDDFRFLTGASNDFAITDGQVSTTNTFSVYTNASRAIGAYGFLSPLGAVGYVGASTVPHSIYASSRILGQEFNAFSDARHKKLRSYSNSSRDLELLNQLKVSNYTFIDTVGKSSKMQMGFIAQEVEKIVPEAVSKIQDYIPSIYDMAKSLVYDAAAQILTVTTNKPHDFATKDEIKLISLEKEHKVKVHKIIDAYTFTVSNWEKPIDRLFVFGKRVDDFRTVDYDRLFMLGISSIQELSRKIEQLEQESSLLKAYKDEFSKIKSEVAGLREEFSSKVFREKPLEK